MDLDRRTRRDADLRVIEFETYFNEEFSGLPEEQKALAASGIRYLDTPNLSLRVEDSTWTITAPDTLLAVRGALPDSVLVELDGEQFSLWVQQQVTFNALLTARRIRLLNGSQRDLAAWDAAWLALLEGWPVVDNDVQFVGRDDNPLDLTSVFTPHDSDEDIAHFFREAGYLHLRGWLDPDDMVKIGDEIDAAIPSYRDGDGRSWWATLDSGERTNVRLQHFVEHSPTSAALLASDQWSALRRAVSGGDELVQGPIEGNCIEALRKPLGVVEGVSDVPWHRDCNFGRHAYQCAGAVIGISVDPGNEDCGMLRVVAGSHRVGMPPYRAHANSYLPVIPVTTERGDITVHQPCTLHESTPPMVQSRRVMYTGFSLRPLENDVPDQARRSELADLREQVHKLQRQPRSPLARTN